jgi:hypothetical protein
MRFYFGLGWEKIYCGQLNGDKSWGKAEKSKIQREVRNEHIRMPIPLREHGSGEA